MVVSLYCLHTFSYQIYKKKTSMRWSTCNQVQKIVHTQSESFIMYEVETSFVKATRFIHFFCVEWIPILINRRQRSHHLCCVLIPKSMKTLDKIPAEEFYFFWINPFSSPKFLTQLKYKKHISNKEEEYLKVTLTTTWFSITFRLRPNCLLFTLWSKPSNSIYWWSNID
jgi:hypothetical protein